MRDELCAALLDRSSDPRFLMLTGDLGFMALEPLQDALGDRFINAGIAEQNMVSVAAGLAKEGWLPSAYSIAPFLYARAFEQIRNDVAMHNLRVNFIGNGGGFGYGVMGPTHHALEDYGLLLTLFPMRVFLPIFGRDVQEAVKRAAVYNGPTYLRLGRDEAPHLASVTEYAPLRKLATGSGTNVLVTIGPVAGLLARESLEKSLDLDIWAISELPLPVKEMPDEFLSEIQSASSVTMLEEHVRHGGFSSAMISDLTVAGFGLKRANIIAPSMNHSGEYGSQNFLRIKAGLTLENVCKTIGDVG